MTAKERRGLEAIVNLKIKDIPPDRREIYKLLRKLLKALAKSMLKKNL